MTSQRDILEVVVAVSFFLLFGALTITGHMDGATLTAMIGGLTAVLTFFFTRSGFAAGSNASQPAQQVQPQITQADIQAAVTQAMQNQPGANNANQVPGNGIR